MHTRLTPENLTVAIIAAALFSVADIVSRDVNLLPVALTQTQKRSRFENVSRLSLYRIPDSLTFCGERVPLEMPDVRERMEQAFYTELSDGQIILDLKRTTKYFPYIEEKLKDKNLPDDIKYLAVAESALRNVVSSKQAAGIWQFTPESAKQYGLIVNDYVDERFNFQKETEAALNMLADLRSSLGSWSLAAAAYNMGLNGIKASMDYQMVNNYYSLYLNEETSRFVFRIVALKEILSHYHAYGFELTPADFYQYPETKIVVVTKIDDIAAWARSRGSNYKEIKLLNPWMINRSLPVGTWAVEIPKYAQPVSSFEDYSINVDDHQMSKNATHKSVKSANPSRKPSEFIYTVRPGDSLDRIAIQFSVTVRQLIEWNNLDNPQQIKAGQKLTIYAGSE
ncbi:MAG: transglycosylase SLT domain-containing protein [Candidatus Kryptoniota bacterium]